MRVNSFSRWTMFRNLDTAKSFVLIHEDGSTSEGELDHSSDLANIRVARQESSWNIMNGLDSWEKRVEASLVQASGNSDTQLILARVSSNRKTPKVEHLINPGVSIDVADDVTQKEQIEFNCSTTDIVGIFVKTGIQA